MSRLNAETKHAILLEYSPRSRTHSFAALARRHAIPGGADVVRHWHDRWNGSAASLQDKQRSGRPRMLSSRQVQQHIRKPILAANRKHRPISYTQLLPSVQAATGSQLSLPNERGKGITKDMLLSYIRDVLAQAVGALDRYPLTLIIDRSTIHKPAEMLQEFHDWGCQELKEILLMPPQSAKRLSPLDNSLFHDWKERVRQHAPLTKQNIQRVMADAWNALPTRLLRSHYKHCGFMRGKDEYFDCPSPAAHRHGS